MHKFLLSFQIVIYTALGNVGEQIPLGSDVCFTGVGAMSVKGRGRVCGMLAIFDWGTECESWEIMLQLH